MRALALVLALALASTACSVALQNSVRSSSVECSTSRFWYLSDLVVAGAWAYVVSRPQNPANPPVAFAPTAVFGASGLLGIYKRHNCVRWRETAPPEVWAAVAEAHRQQAEADAAAAAELASQPVADPVDDPAADPAGITCNGGAIAVGDSCACPDGTSWDGAQCAAIVVTPGRPPPPPPTVVIRRTAPRPQPVQRSPVYRAMFKPAAAAAQSCQVFDQPDAMRACSSYCTGYLAQRLACRCEPGTCR